jgi:hypothetical protein
VCIGVALMAEEGCRAANFGISPLLSVAEFVEERPPLVAGEAAGVFGFYWDDGCTGHGISCG